MAVTVFKKHDFSNLGITDDKATRKRVATAWLTPTLTVSLTTTATVHVGVKGIHLTLGQLLTDRTAEQTEFIYPSHLLASPAQDPAPFQATSFICPRCEVTRAALVRARCASATQHVHNLSPSFGTSPYPSLRSDRVILAVVMPYLTGLRVTVCGSGGVSVKSTGLGDQGVDEQR